MDNKTITIKKIVEVCGGKLISGNENMEPSGYTQDTRAVQENYMYIGIKGENTDGNDYIEKAFENGAMGCIIDKLPNEEVFEKHKGKNIIHVNDSIEAIQKLAKYKRSLYDMPVVGITGSVGKTSTKDMIASVLSKKYNVLKTQGNYNNHIGLPLTLLNLKQDHNAAVLEMGMNHAGEISVLTDMGRPTICVYTTIGTAHIGNLGSRENILKAKLEMLEGIIGQKEVIINYDNDLLSDWKDKQTEYSVTTFGMESNSDYVAYNIEPHTGGSKFNVDIDNVTYDVSVNIAGKGFVYNGLSAIAVGRSLGIEMQDILDGVANFDLTPNRMHIEEVQSNVAVINDCYNASNDSTAAALEVLKNLAAMRRIAVLRRYARTSESSLRIYIEKLEKMLCETRLIY
ncbi:MAG: UDP-N-acetylmuramoyl-tripeptide--D-alanyl-D-alanine ligase [Oscillospiraceae bacterium]|nr:UDP-N-acetylmuramoyl-tripeptide--D-alanyl-D-alanine ligase [Oscillospiraceae bacterium]